MYLSADEIDGMDGVKKTHFLNSKAIRINKSLGDEVGLKNLGVHHITVPPGHYSTEYHAHYYEEECIYIISGRAIATLGEDTQRVKSGDFIGCPANGVAHDLFNDDDEPLVCLVVGQRLEQDMADYPKQEKRLYRNSGEWNLVDHTDIEHIRR